MSEPLVALRPCLCAPLAWAALGPQPGREWPERLGQPRGIPGGHHLSSSAPLSGRAPQAMITRRFALARKRSLDDGAVVRWLETAPEP
jgi:hypothetical protein